MLLSGKRTLGYKISPLTYCFHDRQKQIYSVLIKISSSENTFTNNLTTVYEHESRNKMLRISKEQQTVGGGSLNQSTWLTVKNITVNS